MTKKHPLHTLQHDIYTAKIYPPDNHLGYGVYVYCGDSPLCGFWRQTEKQALEDAKKDLENWVQMNSNDSLEKFSVLELRALYKVFYSHSTKGNYTGDVVGFLNWLEDGIASEVSSAT